MALGVHFESVPGTFNWFTDEECQTPATDAVFKSLAAGDQVTPLYYTFTSDDPNYVQVTKFDPQQNNPLVITMTNQPVLTLEFANPVVLVEYGDEVPENKLKVLVDGAAVTDGSIPVQYVLYDDKGVVKIDETTGKVGNALMPGDDVVVAMAENAGDEYAGGEIHIFYELVVDPRPITITAKDQTIKVGEQVPDLTLPIAYEIGGFELAFDDQIIVTLTTDADTSKVGEADIVVDDVVITPADHAEYYVPKTFDGKLKITDDSEVTPPEVTIADPVFNLDSGTYPEGTEITLTRAAEGAEIYYTTEGKNTLVWATSNGVMSGKGGGMLDPQGLAARAEVAQMLFNYLNI